MDFTIKSRYGQVVLNKPVFLVYRIPMVRHPSVVVHTFKLESCISEASWPILIKFMCSITGMGEGCIRFGADWIKTLVSMATETPIDL